jgi:hypothetical protein
VDFGNVPGWISAVSTTLLGIVAGLFGWYQWRASGFRPVVVAVFETSRQRVAVEITNTGRTAGTVLAVEPHPEDRVAQVPHVVVGANGGLPQPLEPGAVVLLVLRAESTAGFPAGTVIDTRFGPGSTSTVKPPTDSNLDLSSSASILPATRC